MAAAKAAAVAARAAWAARAAAARGVAERVVGVAWPAASKA